MNDQSAALNAAEAGPAASSHRRIGSLSRRMIGVAALWIAALLLIGGFALDRVLTRSIVDTGCELLDGAVVGDADVALDDADAIPIVGRDSTVGSALPAGSRLAPGTTA